MAAWREMAEFGGSEGGVVVWHEECWMDEAVAAITLERDCEHAPVAITSGVYGWMVHTRYFSNLAEGEAAFEEMKPALVTIVDVVVNGADNGEAFEAFVKRFPT